MKDGEKSLDKMLQILECVADCAGGIGAKELVGNLELPRSTVFRMLKFLVEKDYLKNKGGNYILGNMLLKLGNSAASQNSLIKSAHPHLLELSRMTRETVHLAELKGNSVVYIDKVEGSRSIRMGSLIGNMSPLHCTGIGKAILSFLSPDEREKILKDMKYEKFTEHTICSVKGLRTEIESIRKKKVAIDKGEHEEGVFCIASPVFDCSGKVVAAISISGAAVYMRENLTAYSENVKDTAALISREIGG